MSKIKKDLPYLTIPTLKAAWDKDKFKTEQRVFDLIDYHQNLRHSFVVCLYRCVLVHLKRGEDLDAIDYSLESLNNPKDRADKFIKILAKIKEEAEMPIAV